MNIHRIVTYRHMTLFRKLPLAHSCVNLLVTCDNICYASYIRQHLLLAATFATAQMPAAHTAPPRGAGLGFTLFIFWCKVHIVHLLPQLHVVHLLPQLLTLHPLPSRERVDKPQRRRCPSTFMYMYTHTHKNIHAHAFTW